MCYNVLDVCLCVCLCVLAMIKCIQFKLNLFICMYESKICEK